MRSFTIPAGKNTPLVNFDAEESVLEIKGKSYPENSQHFYDELLLYFRGKKLKPRIKIILDFDYISSSSVFALLEMLKKMRELTYTTSFSMIYYYDELDDDMLEIGKNYHRLIGMPIEMRTRK